MFLSINKKSMTKVVWCYAIIMLIFGETKVAKEIFYRAKKSVNI